MLKNILLGLSLCLMSVLAACGDDIKTPGKPIDYYKIVDSFKMETDANGNPRDVHIFWIRPTKLSEEVTYADLISTVMVAADKYYKEKKSVSIIKVIMRIDEQTVNFYDPTLACITYIPDKKGINGITESSVWNDSKARQRGFSRDEVEYLNLYEQLVLQFATQKDKLPTEIANRMGKRITSNPFDNKLLRLTISDQNTIVGK